MTTPKASEQALPQTALITGATGFIGGHLVRHLVRVGWKVHALARQVSTDTDIARAATWHIYKDDYKSVSEAVNTSEPDVVFHLASLFISEHRPEDIDQLVNSNLRFGMHLLEAMHQHNVRQLINTGTNWQHYNNAVYDPVNLYAATKQAFEAMVDYYCLAHDLAAITLKLYDTYGPKDNRNKLLKILIQATISGEVVELTGGEQSIIAIHVCDVNRAFLTAAKMLTNTCSMHGEHKNYSLSNARSYTVKEIVKIIKNIKNSELKVNWGSRPYRTREVMRQPTIIPTLPGWRQIHILEDFLQDCFKETLIKEGD
jgi:nucleoside-diphosphate-sugar epimerase